MTSDTTSRQTLIARATKATIIENRTQIIIQVITPTRNIRTNQIAGTHNQNKVQIQIMIRKATGRRVRPIIMITTHTNPTKERQPTTKEVNSHHTAIKRTREMLIWTTMVNTMTFRITSHARAPLRIRIKWVGIDDISTTTTKSKKITRTPPATPIQIWAILTHSIKRKRVMTTIISPLNNQVTRGNSSTLRNCHTPNNTMASKPTRRNRAIPVLNK